MADLNLREKKLNFNVYRNRKIAKFARGREREGDKRLRKEAASWQIGIFMR
jgi:hypothetical protein